MFQIISICLNVSCNDNYQNIKKGVFLRLFYFGMEIASNMVAVTCNGELNA